MEFQDVVDRRRMIRDFAEEPLDPALVRRALRNATHAPSAGFSQGWAFLLLDSPGDVARWWRSTVPAASLENPDRWLRGMMRAPVLIVPCSSRAAYLRRYDEPDKDHSRKPAPGEVPWSVPYWHMDAAMAALLILQTAVDAGLGGCFFGVPKQRLDAVRAEFGIDAEFEPVGVIALGHRASGTGAAGSPARRTRKPLADVVHRGSWGTPLDGSD